MAAHYYLHLADHVWNAADGSRGTVFPQYAESAADYRRLVTSQAQLLLP